MEQPTRPIEAPAETPEKTFGRRELLKALAAAGGAVTASSLLPGEWAKPVVEVGVLPAHAQVSEGGEGVLARITGCTVLRSDAAPSDPNVFTDSVIRCSATLLPPFDGIELRRTITRNDTGTVIDNRTGHTTSGGVWRFPQDPDFDLGSLASTPEGLIPVGQSLNVVWTFINSDEGTGNCGVNVVIVQQ